MSHGAMMPAAGNPYVNTVTNRNLFQLQSPKPASIGDASSPVVLREVKLCGITTLPNATRAILRVMRAAKPPQVAKEVSLFLASGDPAEDEVQVLAIDVAHGFVKINNAGRPQTLDLAKDAPKASAAPLPSTVSTAPQLPVKSMTASPPVGAAVPSNEEQAWTMALQRERDLAKVAAGQMRAEDMPPYPPNEISDEADKEAMQQGP